MATREPQCCLGCGRDTLAGHGHCRECWASHRPEPEQIGEDDGADRARIPAESDSMWDYANAKEQEQ